MKVLIVDDEEVLRDVLETVLRREGFEVILAASGELIRGVVIAKSPNSPA